MHINQSCPGSTCKSEKGALKMGKEVLLFMTTTINPELSGENSKDIGYN
jgi:hypothetical protein